MRSPSVSVIIATYNSGAYLKGAIDSVLCQSVSDLELIVVDDGSTDGTRAVVEQIQDDRMSYLWQPNAGQTSAKNRGIRQARGEFIGFCDGDDYWYPNKLEVQLPLFHKSQATGVVYSAVDTIDSDGNLLYQLPVNFFRGDVLEHLFLSNFVPFGTALIRRKCIEELGAFDDSLSMGIDWDLWLRISAKYEFDYFPRPTYAYRIWSGQMSKNWRGRYASAFRIMEKFIRDNPGRISSRLQRRAFGNTFANRARARVTEEPLAAIEDGARAVSLDPLDTYTWKTFGRVARVAATNVSRKSRTDGELENYRLLKRTLSPLVTRLTSGCPRIFMYHRFSRQAEAEHVSIEDFRNQMILLRERCEIVPLSELLDRKRAKKPARRLLATVTIDDGYKDLFELAFPLLQELGIRATVFVTTGFVDRKLFLWPDRIRALLNATPDGTYALKGHWEGIQISLGSYAQRESAWRKLASQLVFVSTATRDGAISELAASVNICAEDVDMRPFEAMTWADLREIGRAGFEIADHSYAHACLPTMSDDEIRSDLATSKSMLMNMTGARVRSFAFPNGTRKDCDARVIEALRDAGYEHAVLSVPAPVSLERPFELGRFSGSCTFERFRNPR